MSRLLERRESGLHISSIFHPIEGTVLGGGGGGVAKSAEWKYFMLSSGILHSKKCAQQQNWA